MSSAAISANGNPSVIMYVTRFQASPARTASARIPTKAPSSHQVMAGSVFRVIWYACQIWLNQRAFLGLLCLLCLLFAAGLGAPFFVRAMGQESSGRADRFEPLWWVHGEHFVSGRAGSQPPGAPPSAARGAPAPPVSRVPCAASPDPRAGPPGTTSGPGGQT